MTRSKRKNKTRNRHVEREFKQALHKESHQNVPLCAGIARPYAKPEQHRESESDDAQLEQDLQKFIMGVVEADRKRIGVLLVDREKVFEHAESMPPRTQGRNHVPP